MLIRAGKIKHSSLRIKAKNKNHNIHDYEAKSRAERAVRVVLIELLYLLDILRLLGKTYYSDRAGLLKLSDYCDRKAKRTNRILGLLRSLRLLASS